MINALWEGASSDARVAILTGLDKGNNQQSKQERDSCQLAEGRRLSSKQDMLG